MDQVLVIRHKVLNEGRSMRAVAREMGVSRNTVRRYVEGAPVGERKAAPKARPVLDAVGPRMDELLEASASWTRGKQRLTAHRLHELLTEEGHEIGLTTVKVYVQEWRRRRREVFVPLVYRPGELAEVDFFEVWVDVAGERQKAWMFVMRLMSSKRDFAWLYPRQDQVCFLDGHVRAFAHFGAVPRRVAYDNLKAAVKKLAKNQRELSERFASLSSHYAFEASFCRPYTGHDKGGVEARGKGIRWQHLVPIPSGEHLDEVSVMLQARLDRRHNASAFAEERAEMLALPQDVFDARRRDSRVVSRRALVKVESAYYSVPSTWAGLDVAALIGPQSVELVGPSGTVMHPRLRHGRSVDYRHYLPELARKPQAVRQVAHELMLDLGAPYGRLWRRLVAEQGELDAARSFCRVLRLMLDEGDDVARRRAFKAMRGCTSLTSSLLPDSRRETPRLEPVPERLRDVHVEAARAADFDALLGVTV